MIMHQSTILVIAEYIVGLAAAYALVRYVVIPAVRKQSGSGGTSQSKLPGDGKSNQP